MKRLFVFSLLSCSLLIACTPARRSTTYAAPFPREPEYPYGTEVSPIPSEGAAGIGVEPAPTPAAMPKPTPAAITPASRREARYGLPEGGKAGFMRSPYHPEAGLIDYRGLPPGTEVKDPYTPGKIILVP